MWNWNDLLPADLASYQQNYERRQRIYAMYRAGLRPGEIARRAGRSYTRIHQLLYFYEKDPTRYQTEISPVERYVAETCWLRDFILTENILMEQAARQERRQQRRILRAGASPTELLDRIESAIEYVRDHEQLDKERLISILEGKE